MNVMTRTHADLAPRRIDQARLRVAIDLASLSVAPLWPLDGAIAVNPLTGFEDLPFDEAIRVASTRFGARTGLPLALWRRLSATGRPGRAAVRDGAIAALGGINEAFRLLGPNVSRLDCLMARLFDLPEAEEVLASADPGAVAVADLCATCFDPGPAGLVLPRRDGGLFAATRDVLAHMPGFAPSRMPHDLPDKPLAAIAAMLDRRGVGDAALDEYLGCTVARLPGWAGHIRWRIDHADPDRVADAPATMADLIALLMLADHLVDPPRMVERAADPAGTRVALAQHFGLPDPALGGVAEQVVAMSVTDLALIFQQAAEAEYRDTLVRDLRRTGPQPVRRPAEATLVFCIDVRSEPMRRAIEAVGPWDTAGYAGFFGLPIAIHADGMHRQRQLPVLVGPQHDLVMRPAPGEEAAAERAVQAQRRARWGSAMFGWLKGGSA
ncbi:putative inorganic carbon transporter subunit DabA, partial [Sphingomonas sp. CCH9-H8]